MSHYLTYVYGPRSYAELERVLAPYTEHDRSKNPQWIILKDVPIDFEMTLMDLINTFSKACDKSYTAPILIVDESLSFLEIEDLARISPVVIQYNLDVKQVTANLCFNQDFWDWWQIGGRWPGMFEVKGRERDEVLGGELSWVWDKNPPNLEGKYNSVPVKEVPWAAMMRVRIKQYLALWEIMNPLTEGKPAGYTMVTARNDGSQGLIKMGRGLEDCPSYLFMGEGFWKWFREITANAPAPSDAYGWLSPSEVVGLTKQEVVRLAMARAVVPAYAVVQREWKAPPHYASWMDKYPPTQPEGSVASDLFNMCWPGYPTPEYVDEVLKMFRALSPETVVTAVDIHN